MSGRKYSLAQLTVLSWSPPKMLYNARTLGYDCVGIRPISMGVKGENDFDLAKNKRLFNLTRVWPGPCRNRRFPPVPATGACERSVLSRVASLVGKSRCVRRQSENPAGRTFSNFLAGPEFTFGCHTLSRVRH